MPLVERRHRLEGIGLRRVNCIYGYLINLNHIECSLFENQRCFCLPSLCSQLHDWLATFVLDGWLLAIDQIIRRLRYLWRNSTGSVPLNILDFSSQLFEEVVYGRRDAYETRAVGVRWQCAVHHLRVGWSRFGRFAANSIQVPLFRSGMHIRRCLIRCNHNSCFWYETLLMAWNCCQHSHFSLYGTHTWRVQIRERGGLKVFCILA